MRNRLIKLLPNRAAPGRFYKLATADGAVSLAMDSVVAPAIDESRMCATAIISTPTPDRVRDVMVPRGIWLDDYKLNPVVLWEHGLAGITTPIAKSEHADGRMAIDVFDDRVEGTAYHTSKNQESANIFGLLAERIVRASSIRAGDNSKSSLSRGPDGQAVMVVSWWPLIEWSWGMVGVNPETVTKVLDRGRINGDRLAPSIRKSLIPFAAKVRTDTKKPPLPITSKLQKTLTGKNTMEPNEAEQLQARLAELTPDELAAELQSAQDSGDAELVKLIEGALANGKTDKPGAADATPEESSDDMESAPPSARFLSMLHGKLAAVVSEAESLGHTYENPEVQELVKGFIEQLKTGLGSMSTSFSGLMGGKALGCEGGKCDDTQEGGSKDDELELVKSWITGGGIRPLQAKGHAAQLKALSLKKTLTLNDQATLAAVSAIFAQGVDQQRARIKSLAAEKVAPPPVAPVVVSIAADLEAAKAAREKLTQLLPK